MRTSIRLFAPLLLGSLPATGATPQPGPSPPAVTPRPANAADVARWNDRTTPRKMLETFYFAVSGYDRVPALIANAIDCLDLSGLDPRCAGERDAAPAGPPARGHPEPAGHRPVRRARPPRRGPGGAGGGRRAADLAGPPGRRPMAVRRRDRRPDRADAHARPPGPSARPRRPVPGWPRAGPTRRRRSARSPARRWAAATSRWPRGCLDLRDVPPKLRASEGAEMARKLAFVMQRCALPVLPGGAQRARRLPLRLALQPPRSDHAGAGPAARGPGRLALQPRLACATSTPWSRASAACRPTPATPCSAS